MNEIVNRFLLPGDKFMPGFNYSACRPCTKNKQNKAYTNLKKQEIHEIFIKTIWTKLAFSMARLIEIFKTYLKEQPLLEYCIIKNLLLLKIQNMMNVNIELLQWFIHFLLKGLLMVLLHVRGRRSYLR